jgi:hypothetical protein
MDMSSSFGPDSRGLRVFGTLALLFVTGCATSPASVGGPSAPDGVDIGYGTVDEEQVTGSVSTVQGDGSPQDAGGDAQPCSGRSGHRESLR